MDKCSPQQTFRDLETGFKRCFVQKTGKFPVFKKKGQRDSFYLEGAIRTAGNTIKLSKFGWVKCSEVLPDMANIRKDHLHKLTTYLSQNHRLASAILDGGFYEFKRQLTYKRAWYGSTLTLAPHYFASSKTCTVCGQKKVHLTLKDRIFRCDSCVHEQDRDLNAAINLKNRR